MKMNILVFGGNRFMGAEVVRMLSEMSMVTVWVVNRSGSAPFNSNPDNIKIWKGDRNDEHFYESFPFEEMHYVIDMCLYQPEQAQRIIDSIKWRGQDSILRYIAVSSVAALQTDTELFGEYGTNKAEIERMLLSPRPSLPTDTPKYKAKYKNGHKQVSIIRPSYVLGHKGITSHIHRDQYFRDCIEAGRPVEVDGDGEAEISVCFAFEVVTTILDQLSADNYQHVINVGSKPISIKELIKLYGANSSNEPPLINYNSTSSLIPFPNKECTFGVHDITHETSVVKGVAWTK